MRITIASKKQLQPRRFQTPNELAFPFGPMEVTDTIFSNIDYTELQKTITSAFARPDQQKTRTVLVVYKDHIIAEKYSAGFNQKYAYSWLVGNQKYSGDPLRYS